jgi:NAD dependent epimerase/dehydratase family
MFFVCFFLLLALFALELFSPSALLWKQSRDTVKTVVITSSMAAITDSPTNGKVYTEEDWNEESSLDRNPYYFSKVQAEKAAVAWAEEHENPFKVVFINPFLVIGPEFSATGLNTSNGIFAQLLNGKFPGILALSYGLVDVRDVAAAHILAFENPDSDGRYLVCTETLSMTYLCEFLRENGFGNYPLPTLDLSCSLGASLVKFGARFQDAGTGSYLKTNIGRVPEYDHSKVEGLGLVFRDVRTSVLDTCRDLIARGFVPDLSADHTDHADAGDLRLLAGFLRDSVDERQVKKGARKFKRAFYGSECVDVLCRDKSDDSNDDASSSGAASAQTPFIPVRHRASAVHLCQQVMFHTR